LQAIQERKRSMVLLYLAADDCVSSMNFSNEVVETTPKFRHKMDTY